MVKSVKHTYAPCGKELPLPRHSPNAIRSHKRRRVGTRRETSKAAAGDCPVCTEPLDLTGGDGFFMPPCGNSDHASCMRCAYKMYPDQPIRCTVCRAGVLHPQRL